MEMSVFQQSRWRIFALLALSSTAVFAQQARNPADSQLLGRPAQGIARETAFPEIASGKWTGARLADGQPDISGHYSNTIGNHDNFTDPQGGMMNNPAPRRRPLGAREERAPSRVSDPPDGQVPFQPWAAERVKEFQANFFHPVKPEYVEPMARCAPGGIPKSFYWHGYEIRQYPGHVLFLFDTGYRLVSLDDRPYLPERLKLWNGESRGHWEGNTLIVHAKNLNGKALFGRSGEFHSENATIEERFIFARDGKRYNYVAVITDPTVYTRPFTVTVPERRYTEADPSNDGWNYEATVANHDGKAPLHERYERICHENNAGFGLGVGALNSKLQ
jgi:hypothetical protein